MVKKVVKKKGEDTVKEDNELDENKSIEEPEVEVEEKKSKKKKLSAGQREEMLIENFVGLQHAMTNLSIKFGTLSDNLSELLRVFEGAARSFVKGDKVDDSDMLKKIDALLDQNKTIAKGLVIMEGKLRSRSEEPGYHGYSAIEENMQPSRMQMSPGEQMHPGMIPPGQRPGPPGSQKIRPKPLPEL
ncbi:MAG: hypothetical protein IH845_04200 [Nanoarchaeota archaeon]|nr:hypothetical protein [Nanoarchaeota archaeon]